MYKIDLHTHSTNSHDGGISYAQYKKALDNGHLDYIAVTDHNNVDMALSLQQDLGDRIIVGEEIMTTEGEIIGLFLEAKIPQGMSPIDTIHLIKSQNGIVYIPHPFETIRKGLHPAILEEIADKIDIIEVCNGRAFAQNRSEQTVVWARMNNKPGAASSDAHGYKGLGKTYTTVPSLVSRENLVEQVAHGTPITGRPAIRTLLYPKYNRIRKKISRHV
ncbi:hypothetical protein KDA00_03500 [Candidatus Saccharibacteria bacterium]|nr:hypothetical protein [Candidatus Saccharibacteria bacterium]